MRLFGLCSIVLLSACASIGNLGVSSANESMEVLEATQLPPPSGIDAGAVDRPYRIGAFDTLLIDVVGVPELSGKRVQIDAAGSINFPLLGGVEAAGKTPGELSADIEARLREKFVRYPQVTVVLEDVVSQHVTVDGDVRDPGLYPVIGKMTLRTAVATASGATHPARLGRVTLYRKVGEQDMAAVYNLTAIYRGYYADPEVFADDIVVVGDQQAGRIFKGIPTASASMKAPVIILLRK